jgi:hypothetical protein
LAQGDQNLIFSAAQAITASAASTNVYDMAQGITTETGTYQTNAAAGLPLTFGNATYFGEDLGIGHHRLKLGAWVGAAAFATLTSLQVSWQGAPDNGGGTIAGLTFTTYASGPVIPVASLTANQIIPLPDWPFDPPFQNNPPPRFIRLFYTVAGSNATAGAITAGVFNALSYNRIGAYPSGFSVGP